MSRPGPDLAAGLLPLGLVGGLTWQRFDLPGLYLIGVGLGYLALGTVVAARLPATPSVGIGPANRVTLGRSTLVLPLVPLVAVAPPWPDGLAWWVVGLGTLALLLDGVDGWVARRTGSATTFGARFDMELDSVLMLVLAVLVWRSGAAGAWVILIGLPRYLFVAAGWIWPWLRGELPERRRRKAVCVAQGVLLLVCLGPVIPTTLVTASAVAALGLLVWSFAVDVVWLARHRSAPAT